MCLLCKMVDVNLWTITIAVVYGCHCLSLVCFYLLCIQVVELMDKSIQCTSLSQSTAIMNGVVCTLKATERLSETTLFQTISGLVVKDSWTEAEHLCWVWWWKGLLLNLPLWLLSYPFSLLLWYPLCVPSLSLPLSSFLSFHFLFCSFLFDSLTSFLSVLHIGFLLQYHYFYQFRLHFEGIVKDQFSHVTLLCPIWW